MALPRGLFRHYATWISSIVTVTVLLSGSVQAYFTYRETEVAVAKQQWVEASKAAARINQFVSDIVRHLHATVGLIDTGHIRSSQELQVELHRLLREAPAIMTLRHMSAAGLEQVRLARFSPDVAERGSDQAADAQFVRATPRTPYFGPVQFYKGSEPSMTIAVRPKRTDGGILAAEVSLKPVWQAIADLRFGKTGLVYVVDERANLLAHPDISLVLAKTNLSGFPHVRSAVHATLQRASTEPRITSAVDRASMPVVSSHIGVAVPTWTLLTEQQRAEAYAPVFDSLARSALLLGGALVLGLAASLLLAHRVVRPIERLRAGAELIGGGDLSHRIARASSDELGELATQFNRMAERLQDSYANLERKVKERTRELAEANRLVQSQTQEVSALNAELNRRLNELAARKEEAERANAAKTRFLAAASHDLRQPMHSVGLLVGILGQRIRYPEVRGLVDKIHGSVRAMENLFNSLLDISKLDAGAVKPNIQEFRIDDLLRLTESNYSPQAKEKGLKFRCVCSSATVRSDPVLLERILGNLVANAIRYTERGKVLVGCRRRLGSLEVQVWDTGIGIPAPHLDDVFEEFFQVANPERDRDKGLGLGLSIVKRSAELLGHPLGVTSKVGVGSMFGVEVPAVPCTDALQRARTAESQSPGRLRGAFVVVIDDDRQNRFAMEASFKEWGCHVVSAGSADEAIEKLQGHLRVPDLIVSDYRLRGRLTGPQAVRDLRAFAEADVPALIVTGDIAVAEIEQAAAAGFTILHKPVGPEQLLHTAAQLLGAPQSTA